MAKKKTIKDGEILEESTAGVEEVTETPKQPDTPEIPFEKPQVKRRRFMSLD